MILVLVHEPPSRGRAAHYAVEHDGKMVALCNHWLCEGDITTNGEWFVRREKGTDYICMNCAARVARKEYPENRPARQLPCTEPDRALKLLKRYNGNGLVHILTDAGGASRCGNLRDSQGGWYRWSVVDGTAGEVTCSRCLKSAGLYEGHVPYTMKDAKGKPLPDWRKRLERWNEGRARR